VSRRRATENQTNPSSGQIDLGPNPDVPRARAGEVLIDAAWFENVQWLISRLSNTARLDQAASQATRMGVDEKLASEP
jgi:hypothetical protein